MIRVPCTRRAGSAPPLPPRGAGRPASFLPKRRRRVGGRPAPPARAGGPGGSAPSPPHPPRGGAAHSLWPARSCLHSPSPACSPPVTPASHGGPNRPRPAEATTVTVTIPRSVRRDTIPHNARLDRDGESGRGVAVGWGVVASPPPAAAAALPPGAAPAPRVSAPAASICSTVESFRRTTTSLADTIRLVQSIRTARRITGAHEASPGEQPCRAAGESTCRE